MTAIIYTAERELTTGHTPGTSYELGLRCIAIDPDKIIRKAESRAFSGNTETVNWTNLKAWKITTAALRDGDRDIVKEFLESVIEGETFQFDEFGRVGAPDNPIDVIIDGSYREQRAVRQGDGGEDDYFRFTFQIRTLS